MPRVAAGDRLAALWYIYVGLGLRRGEGLGLRWRDVDLDQGTVQVRRSLQRIRQERNADSAGSRGRLVETAPKTPGSERPSRFPTSLVEILRRHRAQQAAE